METEGATAESDRGLWYHVRWSVVNQYWRFSLLPVAAVTLGMAVAKASHGLAWDWVRWGLAAASFLVADLGMKSLDLSAPDVNIAVDARVQSVVGAAMIGVGVLLGVVIAEWTTRLYYVVVVLGVFLGLAYSLEWFDGRLHDREYVTGWGNLGFVLGWLSTVAGYMALSGTVSPGIALFGLGPLVSFGTMAWVTQDMKDAVYEGVGIEHDRELEHDYDRLKRRELQGQWYRVLGFVAMAAGLVVEFVA